MAFKGQPSTAHEYNKNTECIYCGMYKKMVDAYSHVCTKDREIEVDGQWIGKK